VWQLLAHTQSLTQIMKRCSVDGWLIPLRYAFQDEAHLYMVMDFLPGGDLGMLLRNAGAFDEHYVRFFASEIVTAVEQLHRLGFMHRDLKPENFMIDCRGHIRLIDFGLATSVEHDAATGVASSTTDSSPRRKHHQQHKSVVGSPEYIALEVLADDETLVDQAADWWSVGCVLFELLTGVTPFYGESVAMVFDNVRNWRQVMSGHQELMDELAASGEEPPMSAVAWHLIQHLVCERHERLATMADIQAHEFFASVDWASVEQRRQTPPFVPQLADDFDVSYFDSAHAVSSFESSSITSDAPQHQQAPSSPNPQQQQPPPSPRAMRFAGFTFNPAKKLEACMNLRPTRRQSSANNAAWRQALAKRQRHRTLVLRQGLVSDPAPAIESRTSTGVTDSEHVSL